MRLLMRWLSHSGFNEKSQQDSQASGGNPPQYLGIGTAVLITKKLS